jgi:hypothetical protein
MQLRPHLQVLNAKFPSPTASQCQAPHTSTASQCQAPQTYRSQCSHLQRLSARPHKPTGLIARPPSPTASQCQAPHTYSVTVPGPTHLSGIIPRPHSLTDSQCQDPHTYRVSEPGPIHPEPNRTKAAMLLSCHLQLAPPSLAQPPQAIDRP